MIITTLLVLIALFLSIGFYNASKLQHIHIQKKVTIQSDLEPVFNQVVYLKNFPKWSPFYEADPSQKIKITGNDGNIGAKYHWEGNGGKDLGYQEIKKITPNSYIKMVCDIEKPFKANPTFEYHFTKQDNSVLVTQDFNLKSGFVDAFFMGLFGAKKDMEKMNARGLELLKKIFEH
ncbi:SRPBCC family protein [Tenacibaculum agarivorans]|uniref:SRPBCC family protein n=1 Tax=Tenacibaculum agarivorans TaxID=1908389 RepID=UPI00094BC4CE|nr:SRPBCC family protein [Tenacibaculum agarivorans]